MKFANNLILLSVLLLSTSALADTSTNTGLTTPTTTIQQTTTTTSTPPTPSPADAGIEGAVEAKIAQNSALAGKKIDASSLQGTVTLNGTVDNKTQEEAAIAVAQSVPGVVDVVSKLVIGNAPATTSITTTTTIVNPPAPATTPSN
jgi:osmotically-inducible protein OsmY